MITLRIRSIVWFAAGIAITLVAVAVFAGVRTRASAPAASATYVPITPCRLVDTRPQTQFNVGPRTTPIGAQESHLQQVTGTNGKCVIPSDAIAVSMNVTAVAPTENSFMTLYPADKSLPDASNLNYLAGQAPVPNKVDVSLSPTGAIKVFNLNGQVHLIADIAGYYTTSALADLQAQINAKASSSNVYTKAQVDALLADKSDRPSGSSRLLIPAAAFSPIGDSSTQMLFDADFGSWNIDVGGSYANCAVAPVVLPDGATITALSGEFYATGAATGGLVLYGFPNGDVSATIMATADATNASPAGAYIVTDTSVTMPAVDADTTQYYAQVCLAVAVLEFDYAAIDFTYP